MKETQKKAAKLEGATAMPDKLVECKEPKSPYAELHICEGDSAMSTLKAARDSRYQAIMPIRGKILNVHKSTQAKMLDNKECQGIITALGAGIGTMFLSFGNAFMFGGLLAALAEGKTLREAAAFANAVAALSVQKLGTTPSMPTRTEIDAFIAANSL
jgi:hypothetical protein